MRTPRGPCPKVGRAVNNAPHKPYARHAAPTNTPPGVIALRLAAMLATSALVAAFIVAVIDGIPLLN